MQSWVRENFLAFVTTRQRTRASATRKSMNNVKASMLKWSSHNEYRLKAIINSFDLHDNMVTVTCPALKNGLKIETT